MRIYRYLMLSCAVVLLALAAFSYHNNFIWPDRQASSWNRLSGVLTDVRFLEHQVDNPVATICLDGTDVGYVLGPRLSDEDEARLRSALTVGAPATVWWLPETKPLKDLDRWVMRVDVRESIVFNRGLVRDGTVAVLSVLAPVAFALFSLFMAVRGFRPPSAPDSNVSSARP